MALRLNFFTSCAGNYLAMARVLANSIRTYHPDSKIVLLLCDRLPDFVKPEQEPFDAIIQTEDLPIPNKKAWIFKHNIPELCTGVKGIAFREIFRRFNFDNLVYLDPDTVLFSPLKAVEEALAHADIILTPHVTVPIKHGTPGLIELDWMSQGVYNLGFLAVKNSAEGHRFLTWWAKRCYDHAYYAPTEGLFYDQPFLNFAPAFFPNTYILRETNYNAAFWNSRDRKITCRGNAFFVDDQPLAFFHFTHLGYHEREILEKMDFYGPALTKLVKLYYGRLQQAGSDQVKNSPWWYSRYDDGKPISDHQRTIYRRLPQLEVRFPDPFQTRPLAHAYRHWYYRHYSLAVLCAKAWFSLKDITRPVRHLLRPRRPV